MPSHPKAVPLKWTALVLALAAASTLPARAGVAFENLPTNLNLAPETVSHHAVGGPVLADDFVPAHGGIIRRVEWWGQGVTTNNSWEIALHTDDPALHQPNVDNPFTGALVKYLVNANGVADVAGHADIFHYTVDIPGPLFMGVTAGQEYWFTIANATDGWHWADALSGPTVGSENFNAHVSTGIGPCGDGGPHCGPWTDVHQDFAFRITVPEPGSVMLAGLALLAVAASRRRSGSTGFMPMAA